MPVLRWVHYDLTETRSGVPRQGRPVAGPAEAAMEVDTQSGDGGVDDGQVGGGNEADDLNVDAGALF